MPELSPLNPYEAPVALEEVAERPPPPFAPILRRWNSLRLKYNIIMLGVGVLAMIPYFAIDSDGLIFVGALIYVVMANIFFTLGCIPEIFLTIMTGENDHPKVRLVVFLIGLLFSIGLTTAIGLGV